MKSDEILDILRGNARTSTDDIARELNLTEEQVASGIRLLEESGTLLGYQAIINDQMVQSQAVQAVVEVRITPERGGGFDRFAARIAKFEEVTSCHLMSGSYDLLVIVQGSSLQEIASFISEKLSTIKGVISTATHFRLKAYKQNGVLLIREPKTQRLAVTP